jgi:hypothetical protein
MSASEGNADVVGRADLLGTRPRLIEIELLAKHPVCLEAIHKSAPDIFGRTQELPSRSLINALCKSGRQRTFIKSV